MLAAGCLADNQAFYAIVNALALVIEVGWTLLAPLLGYKHEPSYREGKVKTM